MGNFNILHGPVEEILLLNEFFSVCRYMPYLRRYSPTKLCDAAKLANFCDFFAHWKRRSRDHDRNRKFNIFYRGLYTLICGV